MKLVKTLVAGAVLFSSTSAMAQYITVDGVSWETDVIGGIGDYHDEDWDSSGPFRQWFSSVNTMGTSINQLSTITAPGAVGSFLTGVGEVDSVQSDSDFCNNCELTYAFGGIEVLSLDINTGDYSLDIDNAWMNFYVTDLSTNFKASTIANQADVDAAYGSDLADTWLSLSIASASLSLTLNTTTNQFDLEGSMLTSGRAIGGSAYHNFNTDHFGLGIDATANGISNSGFNPLSGMAKGTLITTADTVPVPAPLALLGLGLVALGLRARKA